MDRVRIWTAPRSVAEMAALDLQNEGLPVTTHFAELETEMYPNALVELWLEDESLLQDEGVREKIDAVVSEHPLKPEDEQEIVEMPFRDTVAEPAAEGRRVIPVGFLIAVIAVVIVLAAFAYFQSR